MTNESIQHFFSFYNSGNYSTREDIEEELAFKTVKDFIEKAYELAFGDDAINREYDPMEVLERLKEFSDNALKLEENLEFWEENDD